MYKEDKKNIGWLKIIVRVVIVFLIFMLSIKLISIGVTKFRNNDDSDYMEENLKIMDKAAKKYFKDDELPTKLGKSNKVTLKELIEKDYIEELKDKDGETCSIDNSFIQATRLDSEYQLKSYLECGDDSDYSNSFIKIDDNKTIKPGTMSTTKKAQKVTTKKTKTTKKTTKKVTTKNTTTTTKKVTTTTAIPLATTTRPTVRLYYTVAFNTNGGNFIPSQSIKPGSRMANVIPKRNGYKFLGWYNNGKKFDVSTKIYKDYVLVAKWVKE